MYDKLNITENHLQALSLFTNGFDRDYYVREIGRLLAISPRTAQLILEDLENKGLLESKTKGKIKTYALRKNSLSRRYVTFTEQYKTIVFFEKHLIIKEVIEQISPFIKGAGIIFGSYAQGIANKESDLDVFIVGEYNKEAVKKVSKKYGIDVSVKCYPPKIFEKNLGNDILVKEVLKSHIVFLNSEWFVSLAMKNG